MIWAAIDVVAPSCARVLMRAHSHLSEVSAVSGSFKHILHSFPAGTFMEYITRAPNGSVFPAGTVAQRYGRYLLVVELHLLPNTSCRREVGAAWTDVAVTLVAGICDSAAEVAGWVARPFPLGELARVVAQLGCDHGLHQHVPLRVQSVPVVGGVNILSKAPSEKRLSNKRDNRPTQDPERMPILCTGPVRKRIHSHA